MSIGTGGAILAAGGLGAGASIAGSLIGSSAAKDAAGQSLAAQREAIAAQQALAKQGLDALAAGTAAGQATLRPFVESQKQALGQLQGFTDPNNPLYSQEQDYATKQIQAQLASQGLLRSRSQGDSLANLQLGLNQQRLGITSGLANSGAAQASSALSAQAGSNAASILAGTAPSLASSLAQLGAIQAQGTLGQASALAGGITGVGNAIQGSLGNYLTNNMQTSQLGLLQQLLAKGGGPSNFSSQIAGSQAALGGVGAGIGNSFGN